MDSLRRLTLVVGGVALAAALLAAVGVVLVAQGAVKSAQQGRGAAIAGAVAGQIATAIAREAAMLELLAQQPLPRQMLLAGQSPDLRRQAEVRLRSYFPQALDVRLIPRGTDQLDDMREPPLGYAELDLIRRAETSEQAQPAGVHALGSDAARVALLRSIPAVSGESAPGHLLLFLPVSLLTDFLGSTVPPGGYAEIRQPTDEGHLSLATSGQTRPEAARVPDEAAIAGTAWRLAYWPDAAAQRLSIGQSITVAAIVLAAGLAAVLAVALVASLFSRLLRADLAVAVSAVRDFTGGNLQSDYGTRVAEVGGAVGAIVAELQNAGGKVRASQAKKSAAAQGATPDIDL